MNLEGFPAPARDKLLHLAHLENILNLLVWDQGVSMPVRGMPDRSQQIKTVQDLMYSFSSDSQYVESLTEALAAAKDQLSYDYLASCIEDSRMTCRVPRSLLHALVENSEASYALWKDAKKQGRFDVVVPTLQRAVDLTLEYFGIFGEFSHPVEAALAFNPMTSYRERGFTINVVRDLFARLEDGLLAIIEECPSQPCTSPLGPLPKHTQKALVSGVLRAMGFDLTSHVLGESDHPFSIMCGRCDHRFTTSYRNSDFRVSLFGAIHEFGHSLYDSVASASAGGDVIGRARSLCVHESQSRMWENQIARSRAFSTFFHRWIDANEPEVASCLQGGDFFSIVNQVKPGPIRVESDELTYNLHICIRFDIEQRLLDGSLRVREVPEYWNASYASKLGVIPRTYTEGPLQDVQWFAFLGLIGGGFVPYAVGNIIAAQLHETLRKEAPSLDDELARGDFSSVRDFVIRRIGLRGGFYGPLDFVERVTGRPLSVEPLIRYLRQKYTRGSNPR